MLLVAVVAVSIILITALLSLIESSILSIDDLRLARILQKKPAHARDIKYIIHNKSEHLSSILLLTTLISIAGSSYIGALAAQKLDHVGMAIFTGLLTYGMLVFAKLLPKLLALQVADRVLGLLAPTVRISCTLLKPLLWGTLVWARMLRFNKVSPITRDDLKSIIKYYSSNGIIGQEESFIAEHALNIHDRKLADLLSDSGPMTWLPADASVEESYEQVKQSPYQRYIVISQGMATGIVLYRHLARAMINGEQTMKIGDLARQAIFMAPETTLLEALERFRSERVSVAILPGNTPEESKFITAKQVYQAILQKSA